MKADGVTLPGDLAARGRGLLLGAAVGDALGWPQEQRSGIVGGARSRNVPAEPKFRQWERSGGTRFARYRETVRSGEYSDDTQLLLAVARSCQRGDGWLDYLTRVELPSWIAYQRGGGRAVVAAARSWLKGVAPWHDEDGAKSDVITRYFNAGANGVAMRIAPHVVVTVAQPDATELLMRVVADGITTHGHPRALLGAAVHALTLRSALLRSGTLEYGRLIDQILEDSSWRHVDLEQAVPPAWLTAFEAHAKESPHASWKRTVDELQVLLDMAKQALERGALADDDATLKELGCFDPKVNGAGTVTAVAAMYVAARAAARPMTGLLKSAFLRNADTDTLASMAGSILGAVHGDEWLGALRHEVQDATYIAQFAGLGHSAAGGGPLQGNLFQEPLERSLRSDDAVKNKDMVQFADELEGKGEKDSGRFVDGRSYEVLERAQLESRSSSSSVLRWRLRLDDGQEIVVDRTRRKKEEGQGAAHSEPDIQGPSTVRGITLFVGDLGRMATFYRNVIGLPVRGGDGAVEIAPFIHLRLRTPDMPASGPITLEIEVPDIERVRERLAGWTATEVKDRIELRDPEGNTLVLYPRKNVLKGPGDST
jgi:ADP-ribosylglycohydrolase/catechol 2,3-dioxygenase-like lactoylglutathione lyase family enzyme